MLCFTNNTLKTDYATGNEMTMTLNAVGESDYKCDFQADKLAYFSTNYMYPYLYSEINLQVGNDVYGK
jgi:hypothetical protein